MKNIISICILLTSFSFQLFSQGDVSKARRIPSGIIIDGNDNEWSKPLNFFDDKSGLMFAIGNDNENLYLCFTMKDELKMRKLMSAGWSIQLSSKEKKKKFKAELGFPGVNVMNFKRSNNNFEKKPAADNLIKTYEMQLTTLPVKGFKSGVKEVKLNDPTGINIGIGADKSQHIVYEIAIPLKELRSPDQIHLDELITLSVVVNALERPSYGNGGGSNMGHPGSMGGGRPGGGMGGSGARRGGGMSGGAGGYRLGNAMPQHAGSGDKGTLFEKSSFKQKFTLTGN